MLDVDQRSSDDELLAAAVGAVRLGRAGDGFLRLAGDGDGDLLARIGPAPHGHGCAALQHHVVGKDRGQPDLGERRGAEENQCQREKVSFHGSYPALRRRRAGSGARSRCAVQSFRSLRCDSRADA